MIIRYVISHMNKDGLRAMTYSHQGRNTKATKKEVETELSHFNKNNSENTLISVFGSQALETFEVSAIRCYDGHHDPMGCFIEEDINPDQKCMSDELKKIIGNARDAKKEAL